MDRPIYLDSLIRKQDNKMIKIITGLRRCGKTYLLFELFYNWIKNNVTNEDHIIHLTLDDRKNIKFRNPDELYKFVKQSVKDNKNTLFFLMKYKGYRASVAYDEQDNLFVGEVFGIDDSLNFHGKSISELQESFQQSIDNYLDLCKAIDKEPNKEYSGSFNVKLTSSANIRS